MQKSKDALAHSRSELRLLLIIYVLSHLEEEMKVLPFHFISKIQVLGKGRGGWEDGFNSELVGKVCS